MVRYQRGQDVNNRGGKVNKQERSITRKRHKYITKLKERELEVEKREVLKFEEAGIENTDK